MKVVIIEDEFPAVERLTKQLSRLEKGFEVSECLDSVVNAIQWFDNHPLPDLVFCDIQLSDGLSFEIFDTIRIDCPIIFTTSYDEYAIKAFKMNSIDYLLKPIKQQELSNAVEKFQKFKSNVDQNKNISNAVDSFATENKAYKKRFLVKTGSLLFPLECDKIAYFYTSNDLVYAKNFEGKKFIIDFNLEQLGKYLNPRHFFRTNRQTIVNINAVQRIHPHFNSKLKIELSPAFEMDLMISKEKSKTFKQWIENSN